MPHLRQHPIFFYTALISLSLLLTRLFHFVLLDWLTIFLLPLLWLGLLGLVSIGLIWSIVFWRRCAKTGKLTGKQRRWRSLPFILSLVILPIAIVVPLDRLWLTYNFQRHLSARQQVIQQIQTHSLSPSSSGSGMVQLPEAYRSTSLGGGEAQVLSWNNQAYVLFFTMRLFGGAAGFVYSDSGTPPPDALFSGYQIIQQWVVQPYWFYIQIGD